MIRRIGKFTYALFLIGFAGFLVVDIWEALGRPGDRCKLCGARFPLNPRAAHNNCTAGPVDLDVDDPREGR